MLQHLRSALTGATLSLLLAAGAQAAAISSLYSTGLDAAGNAQVAGGLDAHYVVVENGNAAAVVISTLPGTYFPNNAQSQWVWQAANGQPTGVTRTFRTTFDLTGLDASTAVINGAWGTDNIGLDILINGNSTGISLPGVLISNFSQLHAFSISSGFVSGINTLEFRVQDAGGVSGFRAQLSGTAAAVPEPASLALVGLGLLAAGALRPRRAG